MMRRAVAAAERDVARHPGQTVRLIAHGLIGRALVGHARGESVREAVQQRAQASTTVYLTRWPPAPYAKVDSLIP